MARQRRTFTRQTKKDIVDAWTSGRAKIEDLEKKYAVSRHQISRWKEQFLARSVESGSNMPKHISPIPVVHQTHSCSDIAREVAYLKIKLAKLEARFMGITDDEIYAGTTA